MNTFILKNLFDYFDSQIYFTIDASAFGRKSFCPLRFKNALFSYRDPWFGRVWCDLLSSFFPGLWVKKAFLSPCTSCLVLPASVNSSWFREFILGKSQVYFFRGVLPNDNDSVPTVDFIVAVFHNGAPFVKSLYWNIEDGEFVLWGDIDEL